MHLSLDSGRMIYGQLVSRKGYAYMNLANNASIVTNNEVTGAIDCASTLSSNHHHHYTLAQFFCSLNFPVYATSEFLLLLIIGRRIQLTIVQTMLSTFDAHYQHPVAPPG